MTDTTTTTELELNDPEQLLTDGGRLGALMLRCPVCGDSYTHHEATTEYQRSDEDGPTTAITVIDSGCRAQPSTANPSARRDAVTLAFHCERGHRFELQFIQHKGQTDIVALVITETIGDTP